MVGGSADLTGSNNTNVKGVPAVTPGNWGGRFIHYGVREHGMAAAMNGMALHGGIIPYSGTFLVFGDYMRPAIRLAALMRQRVIHVLTHDSIGLGEDGPTHQPVEHLASFRAMPNLHVFRPGDAVETAECWELAVARADGPSVLALSRQNLPAFRTEADENRCARGGYIVAEASGGPRRATLIASGSEVQVALGRERPAGRRGHSLRRRVLALLGAFRRAGRGLPDRGAGRRRAAGRHRGRGRLRLVRSGSASAASSSACPASALPRRPKTCSAISASRPRLSPPRCGNAWAPEAIITRDTKGKGQEP